MFTSDGTAVETINLHPAVIPRLVSIGDTFSLYRFTRLRMTIHPTRAVSSVPTSFALAYQPGTSDTAPATVQIMSECSAFLFCSPSQTVPQTAVISRSKLMGENAHQWYKTKDSGNVQVWDEIQGQFFQICSGDLNGESVFKLEYECEFTGTANTAITPLNKLTETPVKQPKEQLDVKEVASVLARALGDALREG